MVILYFSVGFILDKVIKFMLVILNWIMMS